MAPTIRFWRLFALAVLLAACAREPGDSTNTSAAPNAAPQAAAPPAPAAQIDKVDMNAPISTNADESIAQDEAAARASLVLANKNADCVDRLIKAQPLSQSRNQIIDVVTRGCLPIAIREAQLEGKPDASAEPSERGFVAGQVHDLIDGPRT